MPSRGVFCALLFLFFSFCSQAAAAAPHSGGGSPAQVVGKAGAGSGQSPAKVCEALTNGQPAPTRDQRLPSGVPRESSRRVHQPCSVSRRSPWVSPCRWGLSHCHVPPRPHIPELSGSGSDTWQSGRACRKLSPHATCPHQHACMHCVSIITHMIRVTGGC